MTECRRSRKHCRCRRRTEDGGRRTGTEDGGRWRQYLPPPIPPSDIRHRPSALQLNSRSCLAVDLPYHRRLRLTPSHIADTFHRPSPPRPLSPRFYCCISLCPRRLAFIHRHCHWKTPPPSNAPAHHPLLHQRLMHSQLHLMSEYMGMMWGFLKRNPNRRWTAAAQSTGLLSM